MFYTTTFTTERVAEREDVTDVRTCNKIPPIHRLDGDIFPKKSLSS